MNEQENVRVVQQIFTDFGQGNIPGFLEALAEDVDWQTCTPVELPFGGSRRGRDGVMQLFMALGQAVDFEAFEPQEFFAQDATVIAVGRYLSRVKSNGRLYEVKWVMIFTFDDGKVAQFREYYDTAAEREAFAEA